MGETLHLTTVLEPRGPAGAIVLSDEQVAALGDGARTFPVVVTISGRSLPLRLARMGGESLIGFSKAARAEAGIEIGDEVTVDIATESGPRTVEVPDDLAAALAADPVADATFASLAYTHRKEYVRWVVEAKRDETRADRIARTVEMVRAGQRR
ncbi:YdeI/OmpD-associated family protein [Knoellia aerolata]|uniref:2-isopropylmalate synthase n=1 Tax=Knoellia aerolata DSM 18566 TaxID=1385519 RepID=A0A0A0K0X7_9MICO|nr:YdeI/OmpD-associated family protein [Knoellia aerolata]KGN42654.1 2-isopropylmalate synthase [Knoellia aerolata DSM 18566]